MGECFHKHGSHRVFDQAIRVQWATIKLQTSHGKERVGIPRELPYTAKLKPSLTVYCPGCDAEDAILLIYMSTIFFSCGQRQDVSEGSRKEGKM